MTNACLQTKLKSSVQNETLPKLGEIVFELVGQPGGNPLRSGIVNVIDASITTKARIIDSDKTVKFTNQNAREFVINNASTDAEKALGATANTKIGIYPGNNVTITSITEHIKEIPRSFSYYRSTDGITIRISNDYTDPTPVFNLNKIKNIFLSTTVNSLTINDTFAFSGTIEELCIACSQIRGGNVNGYAIHVPSYSTNTFVTFHDVAVEAEYAFKIENSVIKVYDIYDHIGNDTYLKATYQNGSWTYV